MNTISQHALQQYKNCGKKYEYAEVRGLVPRADAYGDALHFGTALHAVLAAGYRGIASGQGFVKAAMAKLSEDYPEWDDLWDVFDYYWQEKGQYDHFDKIVSVETQESITLDDWTITGTFDLLARQHGRMVLWDHKSKGNVRQAFGLLPHDFQLWLYNLILYRKYAEPVETVWNLIRQEVPPGFGHRELRLRKDGKPAANNASTDPEDYLRRLVITKTPAMLEAFEQEVRATLSQLSWSKREGVYVRSETAFGQNACPQCPYFELCKRERGGRTLDEYTLEKLYTRREDAPKTEISLL